MDQKFRVYGLSPEAQLTIILLTFGALYGLTSGAVWNEMVEFAAVLAGKVPYSATNWYYTLRGKDPSLMTTIPALGLSFGISECAMSLITSAATCACSFLAFGLIAFACTRSIWFGILTPLLFVGYIFPNSHYYPVLYPTDFRIFGQFGLYFSLLTIGFWSLRRTSVAALLLGLLAGVHLVWAAAVGPAMVLEAVCWPIPNWKKAVGFGLAGLLISASFYAWGAWKFKGNLNPQPAMSEKALEALAKNLDVEENVTDLETKPVAAVDGKKHEMMNMHTFIIRNDPQPIKAALDFALNSLLLTVLFLFIIFLQKDFWSPELKRLGGILLIVGVMAFIYKIVEELDPTFSILLKLAPQARRMIANRWLNLSMVCLPILVYALTFHLAFRRFWAPAWCLIMAFVVLPKLQLLDQNRPMVITNRYYLLWFFWLLVLATLLKVNHGKFQKYVSVPAGRTRTAVIGLSLLLVVFGVGKRLHDDWKSKSPFSEEDQYAEISAEMRKRPPEQGFILGGAIQGVNGFNSQIRSDRSYHYPSDTRIAFAHGRSISLFCYSDPYITYREFISVVKDCFEKRKPNVWRFLGSAVGATQVLVNSDTKLDLPLVVESGGLRLYQIPGI